MNGFVELNVAAPRGRPTWVAADRVVTVTAMVDTAGKVCGSHIRVDGLAQRLMVAESPDVVLAAVRRALDGPDFDGARTRTGTGKG